LFNYKDLDSKPKDLIETFQGKLFESGRVDIIHNAAIRAEKPARTIAADTNTAVQTISGRRWRKDRKSPLESCVRRFIYRRVAERLSPSFNLFRYRKPPIFNIF